jgi:hypothetical protein
LIQGCEYFYGIVLLARVFYAEILLSSTERANSMLTL